MSKAQAARIKKIQALVIKTGEPKGIVDFFATVLDAKPNWDDKAAEGFVMCKEFMIFAARPQTRGGKPETGLAFITDDLTAAKARLESAQVKFLTEILVDQQNGYKYARFRDPAGNVHELGCFGVAPPEAEVTARELPKGDAELDLVKVLYIQAPLEAAWEMLTKAEHLKRWYNDVLCLELKEGGRWDFGFSGDEEKWTIRGTVLKVQKPDLFCHTFRFRHRPDDPESLVTYRLEAAGAKTTKLTVIHSRFDDKTPTRLDASGGWEGRLSCLKTLLETGKPIDWS